MGTYENRPVIDLEEVVRELSDLGLSVDTIARATRQDSADVRSMIAVGTVSDAVEEKRLEDDFRRLMQASVNHAFKMLQFGSRDDKNMVVRAMLTNTGRAVGKDAKNPNEDIRTAFERLIGEMTDIDAPKTKAITSPTHDRYQETRDAESRSRLR